jgi:Ca2+-transporting ATPase
MAGGAFSSCISIVNGAVPGRIRLHVAGLRGCEGLKSALEAHFRGRDGVRSVSANVWTGNVLICYDTWSGSGDLVASGTAIIEKWASGAAPPASPEPAAGPGGAAAFFKDMLGWLLGKGRDAASRVSPPPTQAVGIRTMPERLARPWHTFDADEVVKIWRSSRTGGLSSEAARRSLAEYGPNALPSFKRRSALAMFADQFKSLPVLLLLGSAALCIVTGGFGDAVVISLVVALNASIGFATEAQAEHTIAALLGLAEPVVAVVRDGFAVRIRGPEVVPGDLLLLARGAPVVADARVVEANWLSVDESALTGESMPVEKSTAAIAGESVPPAQRSNMVFRGTVVTGGSGLAVAVATGQFTEIGKVQRLIAQSSRPETPLERQLGKLSGQLAWVTAAVAGGVLAIGLLRGFTLLEMLHGAISLAVAAVPEGLPVVATTALASAVHAMLRHNVLVRRLDAIEALGAAQVVCLDKTGTLTLNRMSVSWVFAGMRRYLPNGDGSLAADGPEPAPAGPELDRFMEICTLCNESEIVGENGSRGVRGSPTETALMDMARKAGRDIEEIRRKYPLIKTEQRGERRNYMRTLHECGGGRTLAAVKGSPAEVLELCRFYSENGHVSRLSKRQRRIIEEENSRMAESALRVLGVAWQEDGDPENGNHDLIWLGLVGMADPPREGLDEFIRTLRRASIRPVMITGDQTPTAQAVGRTLGLNGVMDAASLEELSAGEWQQSAGGIEIFSRVSPADKLRIVRFLQRNGTVVGMTGDGINDGPALRASDIGIALGQGGTQVAREVADVVLRDDNIHSLISAIREGRRIQENIRTAIHYISATNLSEVLLMTVSLAAGLGRPLSARQLLWINVLTDVFPELAIAMQPAEADVMERAPRDPNKAVIGRGDVARLSRQCGIITAAAFGCYGYGIARYGIGPQAGTIAFLGLAGAQLLHAFSARSETHSLLERDGLPPNRFLTLSVWGAVAGLVLGQFIPGIRTLLGTAPIGPADYLVSAAAAGASLLLNEMLKHGRGFPAPGVPEQRQLPSAAGAARMSSR